MRKFFNLLFIGALTTSAAPMPQSSVSPAILFASLESRTRDDKPVFNRIGYFQRENEDIWMMQQSHHGLDGNPNRWERLAIVVDKRFPQKTAKFYQLAAGKLEWDPGDKKVEYRVSCFLCHPNGPRVIRPNLDLDPSLSIQERLRVFYWNLKIKSYGRVVALSGEEPVGHTPFRFSAEIDNDVLKAKSCTRCHRERGWFARGSLTRQNAVTIDFMVKNGIMPPLGFPLTADDKRAIERFIDGSE